MFCKGIIICCFKAFNEVQKKMLDTSNKLKLCSFEIKRHEMEIHDNKKVLTELKVSVHLVTI